MSINYCDGIPQENQVLDLLRRAPKLDASCDIASDRYGEWEVRYHLSPERSNLLRHLDFAGLDVLELGAGMGAVSRLIAENARSLTVVEGTQKRFGALSERLRDLKNWTGQVANIQDVHLGRKFDVVCVIGVLEYSELFFTNLSGAKTPFHAFLHQAREHLKPEGCLILAIENRLGLKYWSGCAEDHTGGLFDGISGYPRNPSPRTFSRKEILSLLTDSGFSQSQEYFPFPDYKIPSTVISKNLLDSSDPGHSGFLADLASSKSFENYGRPQTRFMSDYLALRGIAEAGLLPEFSNSFLLVSSLAASSNVMNKLRNQEIGKKQLAWHYSLSRRTPVKTVFEIPVNCDKLVARKEILEGASSTIAPHNFEWQAPSPEPVIARTPLRAILVNHAYFGNWAAFSKEFEDFLAWSLAHWKRAGGLDPQAIDAVFINALTSEETPCYFLFDLEWRSPHLVSPSWFIFRNVTAFCRDFEVFQGAPPFSNFRELYQNTCQVLGVNPQFAEDLEQEVLFQEAASRWPSKDRIKTALLNAFEHPLNHSYLPRTAEEEYSRARRLEQIQETLRRNAELETQAVGLHGRIHELQLEGKGLHERIHELQLEGKGLHERIHERQLQIHELHTLLETPPYKITRKLVKIANKFPRFKRFLGFCFKSALLFKKSNS
ncbi:class I SAM-dependent methyltransferase [Bdellovibrionota bacterium FG-2]